MLGFVNKLFISVQLIFFLGHVLLLAELTQKFKFFIIAVWQSESMKRNFERFIFTGNNFCLAKRQFLFKELFYRVLTNSLYDTFWQRIDQNQNFRTKITLLIYKKKFSWQSLIKTLKLITKKLKKCSDLPLFYYSSIALDCTF